LFPFLTETCPLGQSSAGVQLFTVGIVCCGSTVLVGRKMWHGWIIAAVNSLVICVIGFRTAQFGFLPANLFCIGLYANNLSQWRRPK
jgi:hypothetical protein